MERAPELEPTKRPILSWFIVRTTPEGEAPLHIREQWVGTALPVREEALSDEPGMGVLTGTPDQLDLAYPVETADGITALRLAGKEEAAEWWQRHIEESDVACPALLFDAKWGDSLRVK